MLLFVCEHAIQRRYKNADMCYICMKITASQTPAKRSLSNNIQPSKINHIII